MFHMSTLQLDAMTELVNIAVGRSASSLADMLQQSIEVNIPTVHFLSKEASEQKLWQMTHVDLSVVVQSFSGALPGTALFLLPENKRLELTLLMGQGMISSQQALVMSEGAVIEMGNIVLNAFFATFSDLFDCSIETGIPYYQMGSYTDVLSTLNSFEDTEELVLFLQVNLKLANKPIHLFISFVMSEKAALSLRNYLIDYMRTLNVNEPSDHEIEPPM